MPDEPRPVFHLIPHTHWEGAVFKTREQYLDMGLSIILRALALLGQDQDYRFTLDQVCFVRPFLERHPEAAAELRRHVHEGRLAIVGGTDVMLDVNMPGGESFVRQVLYGKRYFREALGVDVTTGWQLDTFGHHAQMPQLLRLSGLQSFWFFRGVPSWETPCEFLWEGLDGTRLPAFWLPQGYAVSYGSPTTLPEFAEFMRQRYASLDQFGRFDHRAGPGGADVCLPEEHLPTLVREYNGLPDRPLELRLATPAEYEAVVLGGNWPVLRGELNPIFQGIYSSRIELKQWTRELETKLTLAEKLGVLLGRLGLDTSDDVIWRAWEPMLFNQAHDLMSGVMTDHVWEDTRSTYDLARRLADQEIDARLRRYCAQIDTTGDTIPVVVFNDLSWPRTDVVTVRVGFTTHDVRSLSLRDPDGAALPVQIAHADRRDDGTLVEADLMFVAQDVPALGHCVYHVIPSTEPQELMEWDGPALENEHYRVTVDPGTGAITSVLVKAIQGEALSGPANVVVQEQDHGDLWEPYRPLDGGSRIAMTEPHPIPPRGQAVYSDEDRAESASLAGGPVMQEITVAHPFGEHSSFQTTIRLYAGLPRIEVHTEIVNHDEFVRYRAVFPTTIAGGKVVHEIPFGAIERPVGLEFPAQNWADWGEGERGVALLNRGLPGNAVIDGAMLLSLCRSTRIVAYGFGGGYEPGMTSDTGLELGKRLCFDYALLPHAGSWPEAGVHRAGMEFNHPLVAATAAPHGGRLPSSWGLLEIAPENVVVSAMEQCPEGGTVLRLYEACGQEQTTVRLRLPEGTVRIDEVNLIEDHMGELQADGHMLEFGLRPFEIKTLRLSFG